MSRTDKDAPYWVGVSRWEPEHLFCTASSRVSNRACDLPEHPPADGVYRWPWPARRVRVPRCTWAPEWSRRDRRRRWYTSPPAAFINYRWTAPQRLAARVECQRAVAEYRASGVVDVMPTVAQHRHGCLWDWS